MSNRASRSPFPLDDEDDVDDAVESNIDFTGALTIEAIASTTSSPFQVLVNTSKTLHDSCNNLEITLNYKLLG